MFFLFPSLILLFFFRLCFATYVCCHPLSCIITKKFIFPLFINLLYLMVWGIKPSKPALQINNVSSYLELSALYKFPTQILTALQVPREARRWQQKKWGSWLNATRLCKLTAWRSNLSTLLIFKINSIAVTSITSSLRSYSSES